MHQSHEYLNMSFHWRSSLCVLLKQRELSHLCTPAFPTTGVVEINKSTPSLPHFTRTSTGHKREPLPQRCVCVWHPIMPLLSIWNFIQHGLRIRQYDCSSDSRAYLPLEGMPVYYVQCFQLSKWLLTLVK